MKLELHNFHPLVIPIYKCHNREAMLKNLTTFMGYISPHWEHTVIGVSYDFEQSMTGRISSIFTCVYKSFNPGLILVWCGLHKIYPVM